MSGGPASGSPARRAWRTPPIGEVAVATIAVVIAGGIYLASYLPRPAPLGPAFALLGVAGLLLVGNVAMLIRLHEFAWGTFFLVAKWAFVGYLIEAGMLEYVFVFDHVRGTTLVVLTIMLAIFGVDIPLLLAFMVARYAGRASSGPP